MSTTHWPEIHSQLDVIVGIADDTSLPNEQTSLACSICSICFYYLENYSSALLYALRSGDLLSESSSEYHNKIIAKALDTYIAISRDENIDEDIELFKEGELKTQLNSVVDELFKTCVARGSFKEAIGIAFEARSIDKISLTLEKAASASGDSLAKYCLNEVLSRTYDDTFKGEVVACLAEFFENSDNTDLNSLFKALHELRNHEKFATLLKKLFSSSNRADALLAVQVAFDINTVADKSFLKFVYDNLKSENNMLSHIFKSNTSKQIFTDFLNKKSQADIACFKVIKESCNNAVLRNAGLCAYAFMNAGTGINTYLTTKDGKDFLKPSNNWSRFSAAAAYGVVYKGTEDSKRVQSFLPKVDLSQNSAAGPFSDGGGLYALGLVNTGAGASKHLDYLATVLQDAIDLKLGDAPDEGMSGFKLKAWEPLISGACLGAGLVGFGRGDGLLSARVAVDDYVTSIESNTKLRIPAERMNNVLEQLLRVVDLDEAVASEAAAWSIGLLMVGHHEAQGGLQNPNSFFARLFETADNRTQHERLIRACSLSLALSLFNSGNSTTGALVHTLVRSSDAIIRYGGMFAYGLAFVATSDSSSIRKLLELAVSDVSNDVRRAAVINLGLICLDEPGKVPDLISLLAESYNPHVRYGSAIALGIASTNLIEEDPAFKTLYNILLNLSEDKVDYVKQAAFIALGMALSQSNWDIEDSRAHRFRQMAEKLYKNNKTSSMSRVGAILGIGILEAGGRNAAIKLYDSKHSVVQSDAVAGFVMFLQYWYWYPLTHMLSLSFSPTALIGVSVSKDLQKIKLEKRFSVECDVDNNTLKTFNYPVKLQGKKTEKRVKIETAVLSMTSNVPKTTEKKPKKKNEEKMDVEEEKTLEEKEEKIEEQRSNMLLNPLRVTQVQEKFIVFKSASDMAFVPVAKDDRHKSGIIVLNSSNPADIVFEDTDELYLDATPKPTAADQPVTTGEDAIIEEA